MELFIGYFLFLSSAGSSAPCSAAYTAYNLSLFIILTSVWEYKKRKLPCWQFYKSDPIVCFITKWYCLQNTDGLNHLYSARPPSGSIRCDLTPAYCSSQYRFFESWAGHRIADLHTGAPHIATLIYLEHTHRFLSKYSCIVRCAYCVHAIVSCTWALVPLARVRRVSGLTLQSHPTTRRPLRHHRAVNQKHLRRITKSDAHPGLIPCSNV